MIACVSEVSGAFGGRNRLQASADEPRECADGARGSFAQVGLELGVDVLDGIQIGRVGGQVPQPAPAASIASRTPATLCVRTLSMKTTSRFFSDGISTCST